jgi:hypothetical protein
MSYEFKLKNGREVPGYHYLGEYIFSISTRIVFEIIFAAVFEENYAEAGPSDEGSEEAVGTDSDRGPPAKPAKKTTIKGMSRKCANNYVERYSSFCAARIEESWQRVQVCLEVQVCPWYTPKDTYLLAHF